jgi:hypothetical protein
MPGALPPVKVNSSTFIMPTALAPSLIWQIIRFASRENIPISLVAHRC